MKNKLWIHTGDGQYIGSKVIVCAVCKEDAEEIIRQELDKSGLSGEPLDVQELKCSRNSVILFQDGDY